VVTCVGTWLTGAIVLCSAALFRILKMMNRVGRRVCSIKSMGSTKKKFVSMVFLFQAICISGCQSSTASSGVSPNTLSPLASPAPQLTAGLVTATQNPLVARYTVVPPRSANITIEFGPDTNYGLQTATAHQVSALVAGMRQFTTYHMRARVDFDDGTQALDSDHTFTTGGLPPARVPKVTVTRPGNLQPNPGIELLDAVSLTSIPNTDPVDAAAFDLSGNLIWFYDLQDGSELDSAFPIKMLPNGDFLMVVTGAADEVREINLAGVTVSRFSAIDVNNFLLSAGYSTVIASMHHDILPLPNGHLIVLASESKTFTDLPGFPGDTAVGGDVLIDLDEHRRPVWVWSTFDHLDIHRQPMGFPDWTHSNAIIYSPDDGNLILSMRNQNWVIKIDYKDGKGVGDILWRLGPGGDFVIPRGSPADFNYAQHYPVLIGGKSSGNYPLLMFDNGNLRVMNSTGTICGAPGEAACYSRPVIFQLDEVAKTAEIVWQYKLPVFSSCCGSINVLANGNVEYDIALLTLGPFSSRVQEVTQASAPQLVWQMDETGQLAYRAFRMPSLYPGVVWTLP
jgi:arylsulfate sulfotransferase